MYPKDSDIPKSFATRGFSLIEVIISLVIATLLITGLVRFYKDTYHSYSQQEQIADRNQNAKFTLNWLVELMQASGANLPDTGWSVCTFSGGILKYGVNPRGAKQFSLIKVSNTNFITVDDALLFAESTNELLNPYSVLIDFRNPSTASVLRTIDKSYNSSGFVKGLKKNVTGWDSIRITASVNLDVGDMIYGYREDQYSLSAGNLILKINGSSANPMVLAENIDQLNFTFRTLTGASTVLWKDARSVSITVRGRTEFKDPKLKPAEYHFISLPMNVILRNKV